MINDRNTTFVVETVTRLRDSSRATAAEYNERGDLAGAMFYAASALAHDQQLTLLAEAIELSEGVRA